MNDLNIDLVQKKKKRVKKIDELVVIKELGKGGFARVLLVKDENTNKQYALKLLDKEKFNINVISREINAHKILNKYPNSIKCHRVGIYKKEIYLLLDYAEKGTLFNYVKKNDRLNQNELFKLLQDVLKLMLFTKEHNVYHFDITSYNVVLHKDQFTLIDYGLSKSEFAVTDLKGHRRYLAPEVYSGKRSFASEIYSLGAVLYFASTGKLLFDIFGKDISFEQKVFKHLYYKPEFQENIPDKVKYLIWRMLEKNPEKRATVEEIYKIIQDDFAIPEYEYRYDKKAMNLDLNDSFALYKKMASDGISQAQYRLGRFYEKGEHVIKNKRLAFYWFNKAVNNEYLVALNKLIKKLKKLRIELYKEENDRYN